MLLIYKYNGMIANYHVGNIPDVFPGRCPELLYFALSGRSKIGIGGNALKGHNVLAWGIAPWTRPGHRPMDHIMGVATWTRHAPKAF